VRRLQFGVLLAFGVSAIVGLVANQIHRAHTIHRAPAPAMADTSLSMAYGSRFIPTRQSFLIKVQGEDGELRNPENFLSIAVVGGQGSCIGSTPAEDGTAWIVTFCQNSDGNLVIAGTAEKLMPANMEVTITPFYGVKRELGLRAIGPNEKGEIKNFETNPRTSIFGTYWKKKDGVRVTKGEKLFEIVANTVGPALLGEAVKNNFGNLLAGALATYVTSKVPEIEAAIKQVNWSDIFNGRKMRELQNSESVDHVGNGGDNDGDNGAKIGGGNHFLRKLSHDYYDDDDYVDEREQRGFVITSCHTGLGALNVRIYPYSSAINLGHTMHGGEGTWNHIHNRYIMKRLPQGTTHAPMQSALVSVDGPGWVRLVLDHVGNGGDCDGNNDAHSGDGNGFLRKLHHDEEDDDDHYDNAPALGGILAVGPYNGREIICWYPEYTMDGQCAWTVLDSESVDAWMYVY